MEMHGKHRPMRSASAALVALALLMGCAKEGGAAEQPRLEGEAAVHFVQRARDYVRLRDSAIASVPKLVSTPSPVEISARERALADAIRSARAGAKQGDLFDGAGKQIEAVVRDDWQSRPFEDRAAAWKEIPLGGVPAIDSAYPAELPLATFPPTLLARLPELPKPLEYRFAGPHLIVHDREANLVVDVLPHVLVDPGKGSKRVSPAMGRDADQ
jgi:hypothetical protein